MKKINLLLKSIVLSSLLINSSFADEAPTGFDNKTNGLITQGDFVHDRTLFEQVETISSGLGPVYNAQSCAECHQNPLSGGSSQVSALRAGQFDGTAFIDLQGGSLIHDRAINAAIQSHVPNNANVTATRLSLSMLGDGFVEAIADSTLQQLAENQAVQTNGVIHGEALMVEVLEAPKTQRIGRFGWKAQHASLLSFNADAFRNEMGITNALFPTENTSNGKSVAAFDTMADPENNGWKVALFTEFVRATKAPARDKKLAASPAAQAGEQLFTQVGCGICHTNSITTAPVGTLINSGTFKIPAALGDKTIHPFSDFLLHDIGTGDGIVQNGGQSTRNKLRTTPLWGLRTRSRLLHDASVMTLMEAIKKHKAEASAVITSFNALSNTEKQQLIKFLESL
jgi:CxxC motif-containing protein (DUF1111 family)